MSTVSFQTETAVFEFDQNDVEHRLNHLASKHNIDDAAEILEFLSLSTEDPIKIPEKYDYFSFIALDLLEAGKGSVKCKLCNTTYQPHQLKPITVGHGRSPFNLNPELKGGVLKKLFGKKRNPPLFGGKGYKCPQGHELIAMITWQT